MNLKSKPPAIVVELIIVGCSMVLLLLAQAGQWL
jgi:hypothetical protein